MTFQSAMFVGLLASSSLVGALAGMHQKAIRERAADFFQQTSLSDLGAIFQGAETNPVDAMTDAPVGSLAPPKGPEGSESFEITSIDYVAWTVPPAPKISKIEIQGPPQLASETKLQTTEASTPKSDIADAEQAVAESIDLMKSAAKERKLSAPSQLDLILSAMPEGDKPAIMINKEQTPEQKLEGPTPTVAASQQIAAVKTPVGTPPAMVRPVSRPAQQEEKRERPSFSAKHYHNLRYHLSGHKKKKSQIACVAELQLIASYTQVYFDTGSSLVDTRGASAARQIAAKMQSCPDAAVSIIGFTDPGGSKELNQRISWSRANSVFHSIRKAGFTMENIEVSSHMEDHPDYCVHYEGIDRRVVFDVREKAKD